MNDDPTQNDDPIHNPPHYRGAGRIEAIHIIEASGVGYHLGNALKYLLRAGKKSTDPTEDYRKALWYLDRYGDLFAGTTPYYERQSMFLLEAYGASKVCDVIAGHIIRGRLDLARERLGQELGHTYF